ncbi:ion channel [Breoghania sp.]|uniref:ion channel n=1 Tax=Breoghania sp. TaxID=2065378 RepID=UPI002AA7FB78|nr:ion channel [Breoghania sp.]
MALRRLYFGDSRKSQIFRTGMVIFDVVTVLYFVVSSMITEQPSLHLADLLIAVVLIADYVTRLWIVVRPMKTALELTTIADLIVIISLLAANFIENLGFLRVLRMLRLLRSYHVLRDLRRNWIWFKRNEEVIQSAVNLFVFIFIVTAIVFVAEAHQNDQINTYVDALYFTVTTLTTTGFGDITIQDTFGRLLTVAIMVIGVTLFLRLVQTIFRPTKYPFTCPDCGLNRHDPDAIHCKHCGRVLKIPTEGES